ncbi:hypothetical protein AWQ21_10335 [Picosynechococcus sp. PCC 7003]|uniref:hypothetical protein n=1 Tax=Picosynechococcus sp. PCC 7003 TaxID=374981 RepID=UPI0008105E25|nr:hypothetical protein [Picosynechococcus sp. PCC 7003]ANV84740.1 hypothetical protein AWQ21_10335 [Picosynechococcus sp. PCC 7003]
MILNYIRYLRNIDLIPMVKKNQELYNVDLTSNDILNWQLDQFNYNWQNIQQNVSYFFNLIENQKLPRSFSSWQEFQELMPIMTRKVIQNHYDQLIDQSKKTDLFLTTGGSTSEPISLPSWNSEVKYDEANRWYARSWYNVTPADKLFLIWGHSHLLGNGVQGWVNSRKRMIKDRLLGYYRISAYNLTTEALEEAGQKLIDFKANYILAYSGVLDRFARVNAHRKSEFHQLKLKVAIGTSECFPRTDSIQVISDTFGCPVAMEYGAVETGNIAHQTPQNIFHVFWRDYLIEVKKNKYQPDQHEILLTTLYPKCFPLIRYEIGDMLITNELRSPFVHTFDKIIGRTNDFIILDDGSSISIATSAFMQAIKGIKRITDYQIIQSKDCTIKLNYVSSSPLIPEEIKEIRRRLQEINPRLEKTLIENVEALEMTVAGKNKRLIREK